MSPSPHAMPIDSWQRPRRPYAVILRLLALAAWALALGASIGAAKATPGTKTPACEFLGLKPGMSREVAHERLERIGHAKGTEEEETGNQTWTLDDPRYRYVVVGFGASGRLEWFSLFARPGGRPVMMRDIGDPFRATRRGNYIYVWTVPARRGRSGYQVVARSQNADTLQSLSVIALRSGEPVHPAGLDSLP